MFGKQAQVTPKGSGPSGPAVGKTQDKGCIDFAETLRWALVKRDSGFGP
jgi:hypothetical protein